MTNIELWANWYRQKWGAVPLALLAGTKEPAAKNWATPTSGDELARLLARGPHNLGLLLGERGGAIVDVDLDDPDACAVAAHVLPITATFGRASQPRSHYIYRCDGSFAPAKFTRPGGSVILELRGDGQQTMVPPSIHPCGEPVALASDSRNLPTGIDAHELRFQGAAIASAVLLRPAWVEGSRHELALALAGRLLEAGLTRERVDWFVRLLALAVSDADLEDRLRCVTDTAARLQRGEPIAGRSALEALVGEPVASRLVRWLAPKAKVGQLGSALDITSLDDRYAYVRGSTTVFDEHLRQHVPIAAVVHEHGAVGTAWKQSASKRTVDRVVFEPGAPARPNVINTFTGLPLKADASSPCSRIVAHIEHVAGGDSGLATWIFNWLAYPLQQPGAKMQTALLVRGGQGTGKSVLGEIMLRIYGHSPQGYGVVIGQHDLESQFNGWMSGALFVVAEEVVSRHGRSEHKNPLKHLVTGRRLRINEKHMAAREEGNHANILFLSNELTPLPLEGDDRRFTVVAMPPTPPVPYFDALWAEIKAGGAAGFLHHLLTRDLAGFDAAAPAYHTAEKDRVIEGGLGPDELFIRAWARGEVFVPDQSADGVYRAFSEWCRASGWEPGTKQRLLRLMGERADLIEKRRDRSAGGDRFRYAPRGGGGEGAQVFALPGRKSGG